MAKYIVSITAPLIREYEIVADNIESAIEIAELEFVRDFPVAANTNVIDEFDTEVLDAYEIDNDGEMIVA